MTAQNAACGRTLLTAATPPRRVEGEAIARRPAHLRTQRWLSNDTTNQMNDLFTKFFNDPNYTVDQAQADYVKILKTAN